MRAILLSLIAAAVSVPLVAQERGLELMHRSDPAPQKFIPAAEVKAPAGQRDAVKPYAVEWVKKRATAKTWKISGWEFVGEYSGLPADELRRGVYQVYRMKFQGSPYIGKELQNDLLFYCQDRFVVWPPEQWSRTRPAPGQYNAVVHGGLKY